MSSRLLGAAKYPAAIILAAAGAALAWCRIGHRSLDTWCWLALRFYARPRGSPQPQMDPAQLEPPVPPQVTAAGSREQLPAFIATPQRSLEPVAETLPRVATPARVDGRRPLWLAPDPDRRQPRAISGTASHNPTAAGDGRAEPHGGDELEPQARIISLPLQASEGDRPAAREPAEAPDPPPVFVGSTHRVGFFSLKGGVGKTTLATEVAALLARDGRFRASTTSPPESIRVALLDMDMASANVSMKLGMTHPTFWDLVVDQAPDKDAVSRALIEHEDSGLHVLLGPPRAVSSSDSRALAMQRVAQVLSYLDDQKFHFVFIDMAGEINDLTTYLLEAVDHLYYVLTPTASSIQDAYRGVETLRRMGHRRKLRFVLNHAHDGFDTSEMLADLGVQLSATVPFDHAFLAAEDEHQPACLADGGTREAIAGLAEAIYPSFVGEPGATSVWRRLRRRLG